MRKYLFALFFLIPIAAAAPSMDGKPSPKCLNMLNVTLEELEGINLQEALKDPNKWSKFKENALAEGKWNKIVQTCCPTCISSNAKEKKICKGCKCGFNDKCTWKCKCCWGPTRC